MYQLILLRFFHEIFIFLVDLIFINEKNCNWQNTLRWKLKIDILDLIKINFWSNEMSKDIFYRSLLTALFICYSYESIFNQHKLRI